VPQPSRDLPIFYLGVRGPAVAATAASHRYKTGTSYRPIRERLGVFRFMTGRYVLGVWVGRADASRFPGCPAFSSAAPLLLKPLPDLGDDSASS